MVEVASISTEKLPAYEAFENQLKTLCLKEFPCGIGSWREGYSSKKKTVKRTVLENVTTKHSVTLKDYGAQYEKSDQLERLTKDILSPWSQDYSWSTEAKELRQIAVKSPWLIDEAFVLSHFKTLRIVNKGVTELDKNLLRLKNLEELTITANQIENLDSRHLPPSLKVLEACANRITDLVDLCVTPPPLLHLGVGHNSISVVEDYITGTYWPALLSLDLSYNNLADLLDIVRKLGTLPKLRNLVLIGNPLSFVPGYRGYIIDSLRSLSSLDDEIISADVKHHFKGLARRREFIVDESKIYLHVNYVRNLPVPEEMKATEELPEWPLITRKWYVQFTVPEETIPPAIELNENEEEELLLEQAEELSEELSHRSGSQLSGDEQVLEDVAVDSPRCEADEEPTQQATGQTDFTERFTNSQKAVFENNSAPVMTTIKSQEITQWVEEEVMEWECRFVRDDLVTVRDFFNDGVKVEVIEEKTESYPADQTEDGKGDKKNSAKGKDDKKKDEPPKRQSAKKDSKKKKKELDIELRHEPAEVTCLASWLVPLNGFLDGNYEHTQMLSQEIEPAPSTVPPDSDKKEKKKGKDKEEKKKPGSAKKGDGKSPAKQVKDGGKKGADTADNDEEILPPPLQIEIRVRLHHWKTAMDSVRDEQERLRLLEEQRQREEEEAAAAAAAAEADSNS